MLSTRNSLVLLMVGVVIAATALPPERVVAQEAQQKPARHVVGTDEMEAKLARSAAAEASDREAIRALLQDQRVERVAESLGLDVKTADAAVSALEGPELAQLASTARFADAALAGGQSITLTYTMIIIILLVVILLVLIL